MNLPFELHVALRYLLAKRKQAFISIISLISTLGVVVGVMALVIALALMTGLQGELRDRILGSTAHVYVFRTGAGITDYQADVAILRQLPHVTGAAPAILGQGLITSAQAKSFLSIKGIDPALEGSVTDIARSMKSGSLSALSEAGDVPAILIGADLAKKLDVRVGDDVHILTAEGTLTPGGMIPRQRRFHVAGTFSLGLYEFDAAYGFVALPAARRLTDRSNPELIELRVDDIYLAPQVAREITSRFPSQYLTQDWSQMNRSLFSAL